MIDNTPDVRWSNAWWGMIFLGFIVPALLVVLFFYCLWFDHAFALRREDRRIIILEVFGLQATLMKVAYLSLALASFSYGYARFHKTLSWYSDFVTALFFFVAATSIVWTTILFF